MGARAERAGGGAARNLSRRLRKLRETEVENLRAVLVADEDVRRLDVAMDDALGMGGVERIGQLDGNVEQVCDFQRSPVDPIAKALALERLHHDVRSAFVVADVEDGADARMTQRARGSSLDAESLECLMARCRLRRKELESDLPAQPFVFGEIHHSHSARTEGTEHPVMRNGAPDHSARSE